MKKIITILLTLFICATATAQVENSIVLDAKSFRAVQQDELTGVNIDPIGLDHSRQTCARVKIKFDRMNKAQIDALEVKMRSNTDLTKQKVADYYDNVLILEMTAKPNTRFYLYSPEFGESNEVTLNLEGNREYEMLASLNQAFSIVVESNVVGADVYIDGVFKGQTGDNKKCTISDVMIGGHRLKVQYGNVSAEQTIEVNDSSISFRLSVNTAASEPQYVVFAVEPKTAAVIIDGKPLTPDTGGVVTTVLQAGTYDYSVSAKMYHSQSGTFTVAGAKVQKSVALAPAFGYLSVGGDMVNGATVFVDDENIGIAPVKSDKLASGEHSVRIVKDKYKPYSTTVTVRDSETTTLAPTLSADFATVTLTTASGATIWVNGVEKGSGSWSGELSTGTYIFEARQRGHRSAQISKTIAATPSRQSYAIPAPTPIVGSVDITSSPAMADITLDGKAVGTTPIKLNNILVGQHKITVSKSGYQPYSATITIAEGKTITENVALKKQITSTLKGVTPIEIDGSLTAEQLVAKGKEFHGKKEYNAAVQYCHRAALMGHVFAQAYLGYCYRNGFGVAQDNYEAVKWYRKAAEQGNSYAQNNLGYCYYKGFGVTQDYYEAVKWYRKAAEQGYAIAQSYLGYCYAIGLGVTQDYTEAVKWYRKAAEQGDADAQYNLGVCYINGYGVTQDNYEAVKWYRKAAEQGNAGAQCNLGNCYRYGEGVVKDYTEAVKWYRKAAEQGDADAQNNLGFCYECGLGVTKSITEAVKWYRKAAEQGHGHAEVGLLRLGY